MSVMMSAAMSIEVVDIRKMTGDSKLKATADVRLAGCVLMKGFGVFEGKSGIFVGMPRKTTQEGKWFDVVEMNGPIRRQVEMKVLEAYDREVDGVAD